ncbi:MAG: glycosyltransferase [Pseudomonadota bacterium]
MSTILPVNAVLASLAWCNETGYSTMMFVISFLAFLAVLAWLGLLFGRHRFWHAEPRLHHDDVVLSDTPTVAAIIPARDESLTIETTVRSLLAQDYSGQLNIIVVDDRSTDDTAALVRALIPEAGPRRTITCLLNSERPEGWSGKLWAVRTGLLHLEAEAEPPGILLLTDADIAHDRRSLTSLFKNMVNGNHDLVSVMVRLRNRSFWERLLIPPFVFFFQMLYPFAAVNRDDLNMAAAAGGCVLLKRDALADAGGIEAVKGALIDDVALGRLIKSRPNGKKRIWLGHALHTASIRAYEDLGSIWHMVARTADTQLDHSLMKLAGTIVGMVIIYLFPPLAVLTWPFHQDAAFGFMGLIAWLLMSAAYTPTLKLYGASIFWGPSLPIASLLYVMMTIDSARLYRQGKGGMWKGRAFHG